MGSTVKGQLAIYLEPTSAPGRQTLLPATAVASTLSLSTQPNATNAGAYMFLHILVSGATASGTVTITGKKVDGTTVVAETSTTLAAATSLQPTSEYATLAPFNTVNASGITITGLTNGVITVYGIYAATKLVPADFNTIEKFDNFSPKDHRGILYKDIRVQQLIKHVTLDKFDTAVYPETSLYWPHCLFGAPVSTSLIASVGSTPDVCLAATAVSGTPLSLTTQPHAPGELLQFIVTSTAVYGTIAITGTNQFGVAASETVVCAAGAGTYYSANVYSAVAASGIAITGLTAGSVAINGFFATKWTFNMPTDPIYTCGVGAFTGTDTAAFPYAIWESGDFTMSVEKELSLTSKVMSQDRVALGNRATSPLIANQLPTYGQPTDYPMSGWATVVYIDPMSDAYGTSQYYDLMDVKISVNTGAKALWTAQNTQVYSRFYRDAPDIKFEATVDFTNQTGIRELPSIGQTPLCFPVQGK